MSTIPGSALVGPIYGSFFFGAILTTAFYGVTCLQTYFYCVHYQNDPLHIKILVATLWVLDTIHEALSVSGVYKLIMAGLAHPVSIMMMNREIVLLYLVTFLAGAPTQGFFVYRLYIFSGKNIVAPIIWAVLSIVMLVFTAVYVAKALYIANGTQIVDFSTLKGGILPALGTVSLSIAAGTDVLIAIFMTFLLYRERAATEFARTAHILQRLAVFAVNTGTWTATFAVLTVIMLQLFKDKAFFTMFIIPLCSIYCNTILANLNARTYLQDAMTTRTDLFGMSLGFRVSDRIKDAEQHEQAKLVSSAHQEVWRTPEVVVMFPDGNPSTTAENV